LLTDTKSDIDFENISQQDIRESKKYFSNIKRHEKINKDIIDYKKEKEIKEKRIPLKRLFSVVENKVERNRMIFIAHTKYNYLLSEISDFLNLNPSTVSRIIKKEL
jgi:DNA-binding MarR family transcriptional regulator